ncbi:hypothetical protein BDV11DRAFT_208878 [Aspergillus similis]
MVYGSEEERSFIREWVNKMHSRVKGGEGDTKYHAQDPDLQLWVAATLYDKRAERVYQEFAVFGTSLQVPRSKWPRDREAFWESFIPLMMYLLRILSVDYLPQEVRAAYGLKPLNRFDRVMKKMLVVQYRLAPGFVRSLPKAYYMKRGRVMVAKLKERGFTGDVRMRKN